MGTVRTTVECEVEPCEFTAELWAASGTTKKPTTFLRSLTPAPLEATCCSYTEAGCRAAAAAAAAAAEELLPRQQR